jgi:hypothetical protein
MCNDGDACTEDACNVETGTCEFTPVVICDDGNECTADACDPGDGTCDYPRVEDATLCAEGLCIAGECGPIGAVFPCTELGIRSAVAAGGGPYTFSCDGPTTVRTEAEIVIDNDVILDGEGNLTIHGRGEHRVLNVPPGVTVTLHGMTIRQGHISDGNGGGIATGGTLTLNDTAVSNNTASSSGCLLRGYGGGIYNTGALTLNNSTVSYNRAEDSYCWLTGTTHGGVGGGIDNRGTLTLTNSTVSYNTAESSVGGITSSPGTVQQIEGALTLTNSTVSGNMADSVGGIWGRFESFGSVLSANTEEGGVRNCVFPAASLGYNIESPGDTCGFNSAGDQVNVSEEQLNLEPLADNGGPTMTHALLPGSVAIDVIPEAACEVDEDQRGVTRPQGTMCDVGAFELEPSSVQQAQLACTRCTPTP